MQEFKYTIIHLQEPEHWIITHQAPSPAWKVVEKAPQTHSKFVLTPSRQAQECSLSLAMARQTLCVWYKYFYFISAKMSAFTQCSLRWRLSWATDPRTP